MSDELQFHLERRAEDLMARARPPPAGSHAGRAARVRIRGEIQGRGAAESRPETRSTNCAPTCDMRLARSAGAKALRRPPSRRSRSASARTRRCSASSTRCSSARFRWRTLMNWSCSTGCARRIRWWPAIPATADRDRPGLGIRTSFSALTVERFREHAATLSDVFAFSPTGTLNIVADRQTDTASGLFVTGSYFAGLGVRAPRRAHLVGV